MLWALQATVNLRQTRLRKAWEEHVPRVRDLRSQRKEFLQTCCRCELVNLCLWCPAPAHLETREMDGATPYFCEVAHAPCPGDSGGRRRTDLIELRGDKGSDE